MKQTAVEWFLYEFQKQVVFEPNSELDLWIKDLIPKAKEMEKEQLHSYAEFAIRCDRKDMKILNFEDWIKLETFKSE